MTDTTAAVRVSQPVADLEDSDLLASFPEGPRLVGTRCRTCGRMMIGSRVVCSTCVGTDVERVALPPTGVLYSFTRVHVRDDAPRVLGYVDLDDDVRTLADLREGGEPLTPDTRVELVVDGDQWFFTRAAQTGDVR